MDFSGANKANPVSRQKLSIKLGALDFYNLKQGKQKMWEGSSLPAYFCCLVPRYKNYEHLKSAL